ncbi:hypothetical protein B0H10DRAFT_503958 [Mycena sp. CBHHK59/15]|nr:hypothetical protein B0H10DRAFT_503958 [Mycena sp. CBHHK59/15]
MFAAEEDEFEDDLGSSPPRHAHADPELIDVDLDDEEEGRDEEDRLWEDEEDVEEQDQDRRGQPRLYIQRDDQQDVNDDDVLPGSSPILSSPVEPEHPFHAATRDVFDTDELEDDVEMDETHNLAKPFDWNHPPAFPRGVLASAPGHLATPLDDEDVPESDGLQVFGTSDLLPTFKSASEADAVAFEDDDTEKNVSNVTDDVPVTLESLPLEPSSITMTKDYVVTEFDEDREFDVDSLGNVDVRTISRSMSMDPHNYTVEEPLTEDEADDRELSLEVVNAEERPDVEESAFEDVTAINNPKEQKPEDDDEVAEDVQEPLVPQEELPEGVRELDAALTSSLNDEEAVQTPTASEPGTSVQLNGNSIPMPISADPAAHDPSVPRPPTTPTRVPMILSLPGSTFLLSPVGTPSGHPTPVALPVPASLLKAMRKRQDSGLFTPVSEMASGSATPHLFQNPAQPSADGQPPAQPESHNVEDTIVDDSQSVAEEPTQTTTLKIGETIEEAEEPLESEHQDHEMGKADSTDPNEPVEQTDIITPEDSDNKDELTVPTATVDPLVENIYVDVTLEEPQREEVAADPTPPQDDEPTAPAEVGDGTVAASPPHVDEMDDHVELDGPQANDSVIHEEEQMAKPYPTQVTLTGKAAPVLGYDPYPYSLSTPGEHFDPTEQDEVSVSSIDKDSEEKTDGETTSPVTSNGNDRPDTEELELQYPSEVDIKLTAEVEVEEVEPADDAEHVSEESETDADGDDDLDYEDMSSASSVVDVVEEPNVDVDVQAIDAGRSSIPSASSPVNDSALVEDVDVPKHSEPTQIPDTEISEGMDASVEAIVTPDEVSSPSGGETAIAPRLVEDSGPVVEEEEDIQVTEEPSRSVLGMYISSWSDALQSHRPAFRAYTSSKRGFSIVCS